MVGDENGRRINYVIKTLKELICITEGKFHQILTNFVQNLAFVQLVFLIEQFWTVQNQFLDTVLDIVLVQILNTI